MVRKKSRKEKRKEGNNDKNEEQQKIKEQLEQFMENSEMPSMDEKESEQLEQDLKQGLPQEDYFEVDNQLKNYANNLVESIFDFYLENDLISEDSYVRFRKETSASNIASLFFQIRTLKDSITAVMNQIQQGNVEPRMYEVLSQLHQKYNEAIKTQANFTLYLEDSFKKIAQEATENDNAKNGIKQPTQEDYDKQDAVEAPIQDADNDEFVSAGSRNIIKQIKEETKSVDNENEDYDGELTDPKNKQNIITKYTNKENLSQDLKDKKETSEHSKSDIKKLNDLI